MKVVNSYGLSQPKHQLSQCLGLLQLILILTSLYFLAVAFVIICLEDLNAHTEDKLVKHLGSKDYQSLMALFHYQSQEHT